MDKVQIIDSMVREAEHVVIDCGEDVKIDVKKHIPYAQKESMAMQYVIYINTTDEQTGVMFDNYRSQLIKLYLICKYYTDMDMQSVQDVSGWYTLHDYFVFAGAYNKLMDAVSDDYCHIDSIIRHIVDSLRKTHDKKNSLEHIVKKMFGGLLNDEDIAQTIAHSPQINNEIVSFMNYVKDKGNNMRPDNSRVKTSNGPVLNISKKKK